MTQLSFLKSLRRLVNYQRNCGITHYAESKGLKSGLKVLSKMAGQDAGADPAATRPSQVPAEPRPESGGEGERQDRPPWSPGLTELSAQIALCTHCALHESRQVATPGNGGEKPALLIVGDWLIPQMGRSPENGETFGREQDIMLAKMIAAIELEPVDVFVTNTIKCSVPAAKNPSPEQVAACSNYLKQQIAALSPRVICAMGTVAAQLLTGSTRALSQMRGRSHPCRLPSVQEIPVMPTYHPTYLLHNPEMKQAAWKDLQAIQRILTGK